jgi:flagellar hook-length control protein FliK
MESLSSYNSLRFLEAKGRSDRSSPSSSETDSVRFPDPLDGQRKAAASEQATGLSERSAESSDLDTPQQEAAGAKRSDSNATEESQGGADFLDSREDENRDINLSGGSTTDDPETIPSGAFGEGSVGEFGEATVPQQGVPAQGALSIALIDPEVVTPVQQTPLSETPGTAPGVSGSNVATGVLAAQAPTAKVTTQTNSSITESSESHPTLSEEAPASTESSTGTYQQSEFEQGPSDDTFSDPLAKPQVSVAQSIDAAIQDARIESIALDSRPVAQTQPVQAAQAIRPGALTLASLTAPPSEAILNQIQARIQPSMNRAVLRLSPESLGRVAVEVTVNGGEVRAEMRVESAESLQVIQKYIPELKAMFAQADMELSELNLELDSDGSGFDWEEETPKDQQTWVGSKAAQKTNSEASNEANLARLSPLEGGLDLIA